MMSDGFANAAVNGSDSNEKSCKSRIFLKKGIYTSKKVCYYIVTGKQKKKQKKMKSAGNIIKKIQ